MKILVVHQLPYRKADYRRAIDHRRHAVTYIGEPDRLADLPADLPCTRLEIGAGEDVVQAVLARLGPADGYERVVSLSEFGVVAACRIREHLGIEGPSLAQTLRVHDKVGMKAALEGSGVRCPRFVAAPPPGDQLPWSGRTVLKPRRGTCSEGVIICETAEEAVRRFRALADPDGYEVEEFVEGDILHADGIVDQGRLVHCVVSRYVNRPADFAAGMPLGSYQTPHDERHHDFVARTVRALGITSGSVHLEFFETPVGELVFLEIANRMGGAGVITAHLRHTGVHLPSYEIAQCLGEEAPRPAGSSGRFHGWLVHPGHQLAPGADHFVRLPERLLNHPCVDRVHRLLPTDPAPRHITYQEWLVPLALEASHRDPAVLAEFLRQWADAASFVTGRAA
ncbi:ATP-grasp domain-containing protein [Streptomyces sp. RerS4]|uniref:ATP-grasp domain-containing protein n=1 Tax=Streptomyces sp. RerS4 TaxID=2942449 RepID=UPI00201BA998|nr:ATP-grasp domain-containing protein [Streptomyces sp. RerS4]UQW99645.1 ATP-grasp domain-containing protein [Streptomyces sp. RerS4]